MSRQSCGAVVAHTEHVWGFHVKAFCPGRVPVQSTVLLETNGYEHVTDRTTKALRDLERSARHAGVEVDWSQVSIEYRGTDETEPPCVVVRAVAVPG